MIFTHPFMKKINNTINMHSNYILTFLSIKCNSILLKNDNMKMSAMEYN